MTYDKVLDPLTNQLSQLLCYRAITQEVIAGPIAQYSSIYLKRLPSQTDQLVSF